MVGEKTKLSTSMFSLAHSAFKGLSQKGLLTLYSIDTHFDASALILTHQQQLLKTLWEREKLLVMSNFSFFHNVFNSYRIIVYPFVHVFDIISFFAAELEEPKIGIWGRGLSVVWLKIKRQLLQSGTVYFAFKTMYLITPVTLTFRHGFSNLFCTLSHQCLDMHDTCIFKIRPGVEEIMEQKWNQ